jgi:hypothetical protein
MSDGVRSRERRKADTLAILAGRGADVWVASASGDGPYLVPLSLAWIGERVVLALGGSSRTARNIVELGTARLGAGHTRDVVMIDAVLERSVPVGQAGEIGERYAAQADWDPRGAGDDYVYLVLRPDRIQAWREAHEIAGRLLMRDGVWLV